MRNYLFLAFFLSFSLCLTNCNNASYQDHSNLDSWWTKYTTDLNINITSFDGVRIKADLFVPKSAYFPGLRPAIIFSSSWALNEQEYLLQAKQFAEKGYIVLSYATRGFGGSGGAVGVASPSDIADVSAIIDWLIDTQPVDIEHIGMAGVSYGAGISLIALAKDSRIATVAAMSGWSDLMKSLFAGNTVKKVWTDLLVASGELTGNLDPAIHQMYENLTEYNNLEETIDWAMERSAVSFVEEINRRNAPVLLANSYKDNLFPPNQHLDFYNQLTTPKKLIMNPGIHITAEISGLFGLTKGVWIDVHNWFDRWLMNKKENINELPVVFNYERERLAFDEIPMQPLNEDEVALTLKSRTKYTTIHSFKDSGASTGIPFISSVLDSYTNIKVKKWLPLINKKYGAIYYTDPLRSSKKLRGIPSLDVWVEANDPNIQMVAYFYSVDQRGFGTFMTHGILTLRDVMAGEAMKVRIEGTAFAFDVPHRDRIAVVIDTYDPLYGRPTDDSFSLKLWNNEEMPLRLTLPEVD